MYWRAINDAGTKPGKVAGDVFGTHADVALLTRYLNELGYEWGFNIDHDNVTYALVLRRHGSEQWLTADKFSSGEREVVHFLLALFALRMCVTAWSWSTNQSSTSTHDGNASSWAFSEISRRLGRTSS